MARALMEVHFSKNEVPQLRPQDSARGAAVKVRHVFCWFYSGNTIQQYVVFFFFDGGDTMHHFLRGNLKDHTFGSSWSSPSETRGSAQICLAL